MDYQLSKVTNIFIAKIGIVFFTMLIFSCNEQKSKNFHYKLNENYIHSVASTLNNKSTIFKQDSVLYVLKYIDGNILLINSKKDSIVKRYILKDSIRSLHNIVAIDSSNLFIYADKKFIIYKNAEFKIYNTEDLEKDGYLTLNQYRPVYYPELDKVYAVSLSYANTSNPVLYDWSFLKCYDLKNKSTSIIDFKFPSIYNNNKIGTPDVLLSNTDSLIVLSFNLDPNVYCLNIFTNKVEKYTCSSNYATLEYQYPENDSSKKEILDKQMTLGQSCDYFGRAFYGNNTIYRVYYPVINEKDGEGNFLTSRDEGCHLLKLNTITKELKEYILPNGYYFMPNSWNLIDNKLHYEKLYNKASNKKIWYYNIQSFTLFDF